MTRAIDLDGLQAASGIQIPLAESVRVRKSIVAVEAVQGFSGVRGVELVVDVLSLLGQVSPTVTVEVQSSANGSDWTQIYSHEFARSGESSFTAEAPDDYLRVFCTPGGGLREAVVSVVAVPVFVDLAAPPGSGTVSEVTSVDESVTITNGTGPTVDLSVSAGTAPDVSDGASVTVAAPSVIEFPDAVVEELVPGTARVSTAAGPGGSQPSSWLLGPYTFTFEDDLDALADPAGVELFTPNVDDFILPIRELVVPWDSAPGDDKLSVFDTVGTFQGAGTVLKPADHADSTNGDRLWGDDGDLAPHDESGDLVVEPTAGSAGGAWLARDSSADAFRSLVRARVATPICLKMTDSEGTPIGTYEGQFEDPPVAQLLPTVGESRFYFFVWRPTLTLPS